MHNFLNSMFIGFSLSLLRELISLFSLFVKQSQRYVHVKISNELLEKENDSSAVMEKTLKTHHKL